MSLWIEGEQYEEVSPGVWHPLEAKPATVTEYVTVGASVVRTVSTAVSGVALRQFSSGATLKQVSSGTTLR